MMCCCFFIVVVVVVLFHETCVFKFLRHSVYEKVIVDMTILNKYF